MNGPSELDLLLEGDSTLWNGLGLTPPATKSRRATKKNLATGAASVPAGAAGPELAEASVALAK